MLLDNRNHGKVIDEMRSSLSSDGRLSILSGIFSIYGFSALKKELSQLKEVRLLLSNWDEAHAMLLSGTSSEVKIKNRLNQAQVAKECAAWLCKIWR